MHGSTSWNWPNTTTPGKGRSGGRRTRVSSPSRGAPSPVVRCRGSYRQCSCRHRPGPRRCCCPNCSNCRPWMTPQSARRLPWIRHRSLSRVRRAWVRRQQRQGAQQILSARHPEGFTPCAARGTATARSQGWQASATQTRAPGPAFRRTSVRGQRAHLPPVRLWKYPNR
jgi:hypothetical protein